MKNKEVVLNEMYVLVLWPDSQEYMEKEWFNTEAVLCNPQPNHRLAGEHSAYFIPIKYVNNVISIKWKK